MSTIKEAVEAIRSLKLKSRPTTMRVADKFLGKFRDILPESKSSTQFIKELRRSLHGKSSG